MLRPLALLSLFHFFLSVEKDLFREEAVFRAAAFFLLYFSCFAQLHSTELN